MSDNATPLIDARTRYCAVYGHPIAHSASPAMHNPAMAALGLNWRYLAFDVHPDNLETAITGAKNMGFIGLNLTVPHKILAVNMVDEVDESARGWGAVNTIRFETLINEQWVPVGQSAADASGPLRSHGFNTDADAVIRAIREDLHMELSDTNVLLLGAGGAGRVAALKLASEAVKCLYLVNRTVRKAEEIAKEIHAQFPQVKTVIGYPSEPVELALNATSLGLKPGDGLPFDPSRFSIGSANAAFDMIYRPAETPFLAVARAAGCRTANGLGMLLYQGAAALELWTGRTAPVSIMREALRKAIYG